jgi:hypothetical protein
MSLSREAFESACKRNEILNYSVNDIFVKLEMELNDKVQMNHYGQPYLFGKKIEVKTTDDEIINIIKSTPKEDYNGHINFFGTWKTDSNK